MKKKEPTYRNADRKESVDGRLRRLRQQYAELEEKEALIAQKDEVISENKEDIEEAARLAAQLE